MYTLGTPPDSDNFTVTEGGTNIAVQLAGGAPRMRADQLGAVKTVTCQWTLEAADFDYFMAFYRTATGFGADPFNISLYGVDGAAFQTYIAQFVPDTFKPLGQTRGLMHLVVASLWVQPNLDTSGDAALLTRYP